MPQTVKLDQADLARLLKLLCTSALRELGYQEPGIEEFHQMVGPLALQEIYRPLILLAFLGRTRTALVDRTPTMLFTEEAPDPEELEGVDWEKVMVLLSEDLRKFLVTELILLSKDSLETLLPGQGLEKNGEEGFDPWAELGRQLAREVLKRFHKEPPVGFTVHKAGRGWLVQPEEGQTLETELRHFFVRRGLPLLAARLTSFQAEQHRLLSQLREHKDENRRLHGKLESLKKEIKNVKKDKLMVDRGASKLKKSNKQMRKRLKTSKDEDGYDGMYG
jgi:hypothetical protein